MLKALPESVVKAVLGVLLTVFGLYKLVTPRLPMLQRERLVYGFGLVAGILGGAYNANGPPVVIYGTLRRWSSDRFRATLQTYFLPSGLAIAIGHGLTGLWTPVVLRLYVYALPIVLLGIFLGGRLNKLVTGDLFDRIVYAFLVGIGGFLFVQGARSVLQAMTA